MLFKVFTNFFLIHMDVVRSFIRTLTTPLSCKVNTYIIKIKRILLYFDMSYLFFIYFSNVTLCVLCMQRTIVIMCN